MMLISLLQQRLAAPLQVFTRTSNPLSGLTLFPLLITLSPALNIGIYFFMNYWNALYTVKSQAVDI